MSSVPQFVRSGVLMDGRYRNAFSLTGRRLFRQVGRDPGDPVLVY